MIVERVTSADGRSSWVVPAFDASWPLLERLRWHAAVARLDAGAPDEALEVHPARATVAGEAVPDVFEVRRRWADGASSIAALSYGDAWAYVNGWGDGYRTAWSDGYGRGRDDEADGLPLDPRTRS